MTFVLLLTSETFFSPCTTSISSPKPSQKGLCGKRIPGENKESERVMSQKRASGVEGQNESRKSGDPAGEGHHLMVPAACRGVLAGSVMLPVGLLSRGNGDGELVFP